MRRAILITIGSLLAVVVLLVGWLLRHDVVKVGRSLQQAIHTEPAVHFAVVGDNHGVNPIYRQIISDIKDKDYAFLLNLADTSEEGRPEEWQAVKDVESQLPFPVYHTVGNHDILTDPTRETFIQAFGHGRWYSFDTGQTHIIVLDDADRKVGFPDEELDWLKKDLAAHTSSTNLIAYHRPFDLPLAAILGDDETKVSGRSVDAFKKIISDATVNYIFTAHIHTYLPYDVAGVPAVISGGGGDPAQAILGGPKNNFFHYLDVTVHGKKVTVTPTRVTLRSTSE